eukprot:2389133-Amphidinium_carterae.1
MSKNVLLTQCLHLLRLFVGNLGFGGLSKVGDFATSHFLLKEFTPNPPDYWRGQFGSVQPLCSCIDPLLASGLAAREYWSLALLSMLLLIRAVVLEPGLL